MNKRAGELEPQEEEKKNELGGEVGWFGKGLGKANDVTVGWTLSFLLCIFMKFMMSSVEFFSDLRHSLFIQIKDNGPEPVLSVFVFS